MWAGADDAASSVGSKEPVYLRYLRDNERVARVASGADSLFPRNVLTIAHDAQDPSFITVSLSLAEPLVRLKPAVVLSSNAQPALKRADGTPMTTGTGETFVTFMQDYDPATLCTSARMEMTKATGVASDESRKAWTLSLWLRASLTGYSVERTHSRYRVHYTTSCRATRGVRGRPPAATTSAMRPSRHKRAVVSKRRTPIKHNEHLCNRI